MLTRHERKERLGFGHLARLAARLEQSAGKRYSISRISQVVNCEKTGQRNHVIEQAVVEEINAQSGLDKCNVSHSQVFPPQAAPAEVAATTSP